MLVILTGAKKNVGDYLIADRAKKLLKHYVDHDLVELDRFQKLDDHLELINSSRALVLCGGPAYASDIYPGIYPLVDDLSKVEVPIIPFGLGWSGKPFKNPEKFKFTPRSYEFLKKVHNNVAYSSCRDDITFDILKNHGFENVIMTGCPVWYDLQSIGKSFPISEEIKSIVITTPADPVLAFQTIRLVNLVRKRYPEAKIILSFHRGIFPDKNTSIRYSAGYLTIAAYGKIIGVNVVDTSYDLKKISFYDDCGLHIGYRVHAHLYFLSKRLPSILINEDGRGEGMVRSMGLPIFNVGDEDLIQKIDEVIQKYQTTNFQEFQNVKNIIDNKFKNLLQFFSSIP